MANIGLVPAGSYFNREHYLPRVVNRDALPPELVDILADPQTSGGLLMAVAPERLETFVITSYSIHYTKLYEGLKRLQRFPKRLDLDHHAPPVAGKVPGLRPERLPSHQEPSL